MDFSSFVFLLLLTVGLNLPRYLIRRKIFKSIRDSLGTIEKHQMRLVPVEAPPPEWVWLNETELAARTEEFLSLGFVWRGDFSVEFPASVIRPSASAPLASPNSLEFGEVAPLPSMEVFSRYFTNHEHQCGAELSAKRVFISFSVAPTSSVNLKTVISTVWGDGGEDIYYMSFMSAPDFLPDLLHCSDMTAWTRLTNATPTQLLEVHLRRRADIEQHVILTRHFKEGQDDYNAYF